MTNTYKRVSFFNLFTYLHLEDGANDGLYIYEDCEITRDSKVITYQGDRLVKGATYEAVWFSFTHATFRFITSWVGKSDLKDHNRVPGPGSLVIAQADLAPYLVWWDKDLPKEKV
jgi:hypothetical protein